MRIPRNWLRPAIDALWCPAHPRIVGGRASRRAVFPPGPAKASPPRELISFAFLTDLQREGLGGGAAHAVGGGEVQGVGASRPRRRGAAEHAGGRIELLLRGLEKVSAEWQLICLTHNLVKIWRRANRAGMS